ncbi:hypothetical protein G7Y89_g7752 [Cudoniella acicularis]|uniref:Zn(2)-C6 fungal-type domain-containing protein n=1 Tax=Cudoniella acicularis TaxID=354080 RepID=A0A8H4RK71_9HELO|nr:hypothetical protein G7Y89_g7752 [Cudoniella acicularis]
MAILHVIALHPSSGADGDGMGRKPPSKSHTKRTRNVKKNRKNICQTCKDLHKWCDGGNPCGPCNEKYRDCRPQQRHVQTTTAPRPTYPALTLATASRPLSSSASSVSTPNAPQGLQHQHQIPLPSNFPPPYPPGIAQFSNLQPPQQPLSTIQPSSLTAGMAPSVATAATLSHYIDPINYFFLQDNHIDNLDVAGRQAVFDNLVDIASELPSQELNRYLAELDMQRQVVNAVLQERAQAQYQTQYQDDQPEAHEDETMN